MKQAIYVYSINNAKTKFFYNTHAKKKSHDTVNEYWRSF